MTILCIQHSCKYYICSSKLKYWLSIIYHRLRIHMGTHFYFQMKILLCILQSCQIFLIVIVENKQTKYLSTQLSTLICEARLDYVLLPSFKMKHYRSCVNRIYYEQVINTLFTRKMRLRGLKKYLPNTEHIIRKLSLR